MSLSSPDILWFYDHRRHVLPWHQPQHSFNPITELLCAGSCGPAGRTGSDGCSEVWREAARGGPEPGEQDISAERATPEC